MLKPRKATEDKEEEKEEWEEREEGEEHADTAPQPFTPKFEFNYHPLRKRIYLLKMLERHWLTVKTMTSPPWEQELPETLKPMHGECRFSTIHLYTHSFTLQFIYCYG